MPLRFTESGLDAASEGMVTVAERAPAAVGVKVTSNEQELVGVTVAPVHVSFWSAKSPGLVPARARVPTFKSVLPLFVSVT